MNWYIAKIVYQIICGNGHHTPQFDEQLRLVEAGSEAEALSKAKQLGFAGEETFVNDQQALVRWVFINIVELTALPAIADGAEIYSRITEVDNAPAYREAVHRRAAQLSERASTIFCATI